MSESKLFFGGIPTDIEVKALIDRFGAPKPGVILNEEIEETTGVEYGTNRFRTIVTRWRKKLWRDYNIDTEAAKGEGIRILTEPERVDVSEVDFGRGSKRVLRSHIRARSVRSEDLDSLALKKHEHLIRCTLTAVDTLKRVAKDYSKALRPKEQRPQIGSGA